jgi:hypothetical protein
MRSRRRSNTDAVEAARPEVESGDVARDDDLATMDDDRAKAFLRSNTTEVIERMRQPSDPTNNIAAKIVAQHAIDPRLRAEAKRALEDTRTATEAKSALDHALAGYTQSDLPLRSQPKQ